MRTRKQIEKTLSTLCFMATVSISAGQVYETILSVDLGSGPVESGFVGQSTGAATHSTLKGNVTVTIAGQQGAFDRGVTGFPNSDFYRDFIFDNGGTFSMTLDGPGMATSTPYQLTFWCYDSGEGNSGGRYSTFEPGGDTTGPTVGPIGPNAPTPTGLDDPLFTTNGVYTVGASGALTILVNSANNRTACNGIRIAQQAPPSGTVMAIR